MTPKQVVILAAALILALIVTIVAGFALQPVTLQPLGAGPWWHTLLRILVPLVWVFFFILFSMWGVVALIAAIQGRRGAA